MKRVITGGPGSGKTTLINLLQEKGFSVTPEAAREVLKEYGRQGDFQRRIVDRQIELEDQTKGEYLDRSLADNLAYMKEEEKQSDYGIWLKEKVISRNYDQVFILEPVGKENYRNDAQRNESYEESVALYEKLYTTYKDLGFEPTILKATTPQDRLEKILAYQKGGNN